ncbi:thiol reductant ABC exporter subunit CydC [Metabacillus sp. 113a]|uniref:thiol reductant ABC exporter subunit CydC n=1 Tax=Metabacillus sp. 113a TaxID=3404706 RepID=UPI003CF0439C
MKSLFAISQIAMREKKDIMLTALLGVSAALIGTALFGASGYVISKAALIPPLYTLTVMLALLKLFGIARAVSRYGERYFSHKATFTILGNMRAAFFERLEPMSPALLQRWRSGDLLARIVGDVESLQNFFLRVFYPPVVFFFVFLSTFFFSSFYSVWICLIIAAGMILTGIAVPAFFAWQQQRRKNTVQMLRRELSAEAAEFLYGFRELKIHQKADEKEAALLEKSERYLKEQEARLADENRSQSLNLLLSMIVCWGIAIAGVYEVTHGRMDGIYLAMLIMIGLNVFEYAIPMAVFPSYYADSKQSSKQLFSAVSGNFGVQEKEEPLELSKHGSIEVKVRDLTFAFPDEGRDTLHSISVTFPKGSKTAIVGPSGSGKSTLVQLILKMAEAKSGELYVNGAPIHRLRKEDIWQAANAVLQENHFFYGTIRENLLLADGHATEEELERALQEAELDTHRLDDRVLEKGENLSGGERQKLALARAFLKKGRIWLLDEPFSSMDLLTEKNMVQRIFNKTQEATVIFISHRLSGLENMDQILVMDEGTVVEAGSFSDLMERKGYFYELKKVEADILSQ